ncbi:hypothetical protein LLEC1_00267 [Akanthomyces lecanii]|uniref:Ribosomal eL28/Mak16 domain-containing protein n=1 Tax=Cordyceps confragosa TaxID=2714763 RepID=A0A179HZ98_CORDF|nr:hypothetical protein LLEC1_00267 [Akanthomyces lecanii]
MSAPALNNVSSDIVWAIVRDNHCFLSKSRRNGGAQFSSDPLNLTNKNTRKHAGFVNDKAIGVIPGEKGGLTILSKTIKNSTKPAKAFSKTNISGAKSTRKIYKTVANQTTKTGYRSDLRQHAVERVSAIRRTQRPVKETPEAKPRGKKAQNAAESS